VHRRVVEDESPNGDVEPVPRRTPFRAEMNGHRPISTVLRRKMPARKRFPRNVLREWMARWGRGAANSKVGRGGQSERRHFAIGARSGLLLKVLILSPSSTSSNRTLTRTVRRACSACFCVQRSVRGLVDTYFCPYVVILSSYYSRRISRGCIVPDSRSAMALRFGCLLMFISNTLNLAYVMSRLAASDISCDDPSHDRIRGVVCVDICFNP
jgi:hypothetical protein